MAQQALTTRILSALKNKGAMRGTYREIAGRLGIECQYQDFKKACQELAGRDKISCVELQGDGRYEIAKV